MRAHVRLQAGVLPSGDAVCCIPTTLVALCLNAKGLERVAASRALDCFVPIFTTPAYLRALQVLLGASSCRWSPCCPKAAPSGSACCFVRKLHSHSSAAIGSA